MVDNGFQLPLGYETAKLREVLRVCPRNEAPDALTKQSAAKSGLQESAEAAPASDNYQGTPWLQSPPESGYSLQSRDVEDDVVVIGSAREVRLVVVYDNVCPY